ncbi:MAG: mechanosensitive ion channel family protein [Muribaculaceae bacterium]|nr:mechanosensitive ion channel family protein [Muribaculaceae bacterium]
MRKQPLYLILLLIILSVPTADAQLFKRAEQFLHTAFSDAGQVSADEAIPDSLRSAGAPILLDGDTILTLFAGRGAYTPAQRAILINSNLADLTRRNDLNTDSIKVLDYAEHSDIVCGTQIIMAVTDDDALTAGESRRTLATRYATNICTRIDTARHDHNFFQILKRIALFIIVVVVQWLLIKLTNYLFRKLRRYIVRIKHQRFKPINIRDYELLNTKSILRIVLLGANLLRWFVLLIQLAITIPIIFSIFPQTENLALTIFMYIIEPVKMVLHSVLDYIPNLFVILVIWYCIKYIIKGLRYISREIETEKLKINGFYPDWARPTFSIVRFLLYAFMIAMIYPYLPGSNSGVFQGISVFVGLIISLGSSTVIGNIIAGLVITYMRPFKLGDRIKLNDTTGNVIEKTPFVTRIKTPKNEIVTIPNSFIMSSHTINYSASARQYGLIIHTTVTIGYDAPWRQVHQLLINAARMTTGVLADPKPFVLETDLQDYYPCYQINAYIKDADKYGDIMSDLHRNIQDVFNEAGVEIMSPHYIATRDGSPSTIPTDPMRDCVEK